MRPAAVSLLSDCRHGVVSVVTFLTPTPGRMNADSSHGHCALVLFPQHALISSDTELSKPILHLPVPEHVTRALLFDK